MDLEGATDPSDRTESDAAAGPLANADDDDCTQPAEDTSSQPLEMPCLSQHSGANQGAHPGCNASSHVPTGEPSQKDSEGEVPTQLSRKRGLVATPKQTAEAVSPTEAADRHLLESCGALPLHTLTDGGAASSNNSQAGWKRKGTTTTKKHKPCERNGSAHCGGKGVCQCPKEHPHPGGCEGSATRCSNCHAYGHNKSTCTKRGGDCFKG